MTRMIFVPLLAPIVAISAAAPLSAQAPVGTPDTRYCMKVEAATNSRIERVMCWTRAEWSAEGVDIDHDWAAEGVRTVG